MSLDPSVMSEDQPAKKPAPYRVLARKYRPVKFSELIGQQAMVRTITNAIQSGRLAHAFILTGVRGIGKTTTARIIARALNCIGKDGDNQADLTPEPCGECVHCRDIAEDRHVDVIEMDAASRTGVEDIRELIDGVRYRPTSARYKVYIIDEVHMLSKNAFNALLKTLEEPPEHVKFIFATTETRKVPVTVLSRCQRFDLRRVDSKTLAAHFAGVAEKEGVKISPKALSMIAAAADGSVRDGLSLLDQAISHTGGDIDDTQVRSMLGLADRTITFDLMDALMSGEVAQALKLLEKQYQSGADPVQILEDMLELSHWLTRVKITTDAADDALTPEMERVRGKDMANRLSMASLAMSWQMLLKGLAEVRAASHPLQAAQMIIVRLAYSTTLPTPQEAIKTIIDTPVAALPIPASATKAKTTQPEQPPPTTTTPTMSAGQTELAQAVETVIEAIPAPQAQTTDYAPDHNLNTFDDVVLLAEEKGEMILHANLLSNVHLVRFEPGIVEFSLAEHADSSLAPKLSKFLQENTNQRWMVMVSNEAGEATLRQRKNEDIAKVKAEAGEHPLIKKIMKTFPGATINEVREITDEKK